MLGSPRPHCSSPAAVSSLLLVGGCRGIALAPSLLPFLCGVCVCVCVCVGLRSFCFLSLVAWCCAADLAGSHPAVSPGAARSTTTTATTALCMHACTHASKEKRRTGPLSCVVQPGKWMESRGSADCRVG